ncbi:MAG: tetratricopeptide repeat protein, partial [Desulfobacteraceae bacterium]|nr:tetratricopeptide repeat protein [Desulfobacteraceae bacterium]
KIKKYLKILKWCAANNPRYYQPWYQVAQGEFLRIKGDLDKAGDCFQAARKALEKDPDALYVKALVLEKLGRINEAKNDIQGAEKFLQDAVTLYRQWGLKWKHGLFDADETDVSETDNSIDNAMDVISPPPSPSGQTVPKDDLENILFRIYDISHAEAVHAVVLNARQWQSQVSVANDSVLRPSILVDLPQQMLSFASAAGKATRATANDLEEDFFDTAYFFKHKPESLVVVPGGTDKGICIENPEQDLNMDAINKLAEQVFKRLKPQADADPDLPEKDTQELLQLKACCQKLKYH